jgi:uncharacterized membrane-anchored protein YitT (DUF2179 family)
MTDKLGFWATSPTRHSVFEDIQGLFAGSMLVALGVAFLGNAGLLSGGTAGIALLLHYATGYSLGLVFFLVNLPFYYLSYRKLGWVFTVKSFMSVALFSVIVELQKHVFQLQAINPIWAAIMGGLLVGMGLLAMFRHNASLGGVSVLAIYAQEKFGFRVGLVQLGIDVVILAVSFAIASPWIVFCSVIGALTVNLFIAINHRKDRYIAM